MILNFYVITKEDIKFSTIIEDDTKFCESDNALFFETVEISKGYLYQEH